MLASEFSADAAPTAGDSAAASSAALVCVAAPAGPFVIGALGTGAFDSLAAVQLPAEPSAFPQTVIGAATGAPAREPDPDAAADVAGVLQDAEPPAEFPHTVAGAANGAATELFEFDPPASDDVVPAPLHCAAAVPLVPAVFPQTVTGAATGALAAGLDDDAPPEVPEAEFAVALEDPVVPQDADDEPTALPQTFTGAATGALAVPPEPDDDVPLDPVHCAELAPPVLTELPHTFTGAFTGALAAEADDELPEPPPLVEPPDELLPDELPAVVPDEPPLVPFGLSTDTELLLTLAGAATGTSAAFEEPGVAAPTEAFVVPD